MSIPFDDARISAAKDKGQEIIVVLGLGFVGTAVAANLARTEKNDEPVFYVIGVDQDSPPGREKCERLNKGLPPVYASDESLESVISKVSREYQNISGTTDSNVLALADTVVFCINLDLERAPGQTENFNMNVDGYAKAMKMVGSKIKPDTLVTVESTLPLGMCDKVLYPALCEGQREQGFDPEKNPPLLAFCYERVMPGPGYLDSVNNFWRAYAGVNKESNRRAREFLRKFVNIQEYPLWEHKSTRAAEMAKLLENSYRATNIAFIEEWAKIAEQVNVDLFDVINSVKVRKGTHDNMMRPGLGVGGYCLTKDALLAAYGTEKLLNKKAELPFSRMAILTNERMPTRTVDWVKEHFGTSLKNKKASLLGVTYRPEVADSRSSATELVARAMLHEGVAVFAYDPLVTEWEELPEVSVSKDPYIATQDADIVVICLPDSGYTDFLCPLLTKNLKKGAIVIDPWDMVGDALARDLMARGITLKVYGRGDISTKVAA